MRQACFLLRGLAAVQMDVSELIERYPRLYHATHMDAWPGIAAHGLLSTSALLDLFEIHGSRRFAIEAFGAQSPSSSSIPCSAEL